LSTRNRAVSTAKSAGRRGATLRTPLDKFVRISYRLEHQLMLLEDFGQLLEVKNYKTVQPEKNSLKRLTFGMSST